MRTFLRFAAIGLILALLTVVLPLRTPSASGDLTSDLKAAQQKMTALKGQLTEIQRLIQQNKSAKYSLLAQLSDLNDQMDQLGDDMDQINSRIASLEDLLKKTSAQLAAKEKLYQELSLTTESSIDLLYRVSNLDVAGLPFTGGDVNATVAAQAGVSAVLQQITASLSAVSTQKLALEADRVEYARTKQQLEEVYVVKKDQAALLAQQQAVKKQTAEYLAGKGSQYTADELKIKKEMERENKFIEQVIAEIERQKYAGTVDSGKLSWPIAGHITITDVFAMRHDPINGVWEQHTGMDIGTRTGTPILAPADGIVVFAARNGGYGNMMMVQHSQTMTTVYGHLKSYIAKKGQYVKRGQVIALSDNTGWSTGPHLHFEVRISGVAKNPMLYLGPKP
ncbi:MAG: murein hydrolase activator EnvC family protein [Candidatus Cryosericum sp.]